jgi:DnaK suppressor protein
MERADTEVSSGLTPEQVQFLRERLVRMRSDLRTRLQREQAVATEGEHLPEPMDAAEQTREQDDAVLFTERDRTLLREVEHALSKFENGTYGVSEVSGRPIGFPRLKAIPWTRVTADEVMEEG